MGILVPLFINQARCYVDRVQRAYNVVFGLFQAPYYAFSQTMMAELTPPGFDNMVSCLRCPFPCLLISSFVSVFRPVRVVESCVFDDWPKRYSGDHR